MVATSIDVPGSLWFSRGGVGLTRFVGHDAASSFRSGQRPSTLDSLRQSRSGSRRGLRSFVALGRFHQQTLVFRGVALFRRLRSVDGLHEVGAQPQDGILRDRRSSSGRRRQAMPPPPAGSSRGTGLYGHVLFHGQVGDAAQLEGLLGGRGIDGQLGELVQVGTTASGQSLAAAAIPIDAAASRGGSTRQDGGIVVGFVGTVLVRVARSSSVRIVAWLVEDLVQTHGSIPIQASRRLSGGRSHGWRRRMEYKIKSDAGVLYSGQRFPCFDCTTRV